MENFQPEEEPVPITSITESDTEEKESGNAKIDSSLEANESHRTEDENIKSSELGRKNQRKNQTSKQERLIPVDGMLSKYFNALLSKYLPKRSEKNTEVCGDAGAGASSSHASNVNQNDSQVNETKEGAYDNGSEQKKVYSEEEKQVIMNVMILAERRRRFWRSNDAHKQKAREDANKDRTD